MCEVQLAQDTAAVRGAVSPGAELLAGTDDAAPSEASSSSGRLCWREWHRTTLE